MIKEYLQNQEQQVANVILQLAIKQSAIEERLAQIEWERRQLETQREDLKSQIAQQRKILERTHTQLSQFEEKPDGEAEAPSGPVLHDDVAEPEEILPFQTGHVGGSDHD